MDEHGRVAAIHVAPEQGAPVEPRETVRAVAGRGLRGDRYFEETGTFADRAGSDLTLIGRAALDAVEREHGLDLAPGVHRRNLTVAGVDPGELVGERFRVGDAVCVGTERCAPCAYLERRLAREGVRAALVDRGGLRARIVDSGPVRVGDGLQPPGTERLNPDRTDGGV